MLANTESGIGTGDQSWGYLRVMCGPRYNTFAVVMEHRDEPGKFFQPAVSRAMRRRVDEETELWDGLE